MHLLVCLEFFIINILNWGTIYIIKDVKAYEDIY